IGAAMRPAQFFMIGVPGNDVLLRRPFSVCGLPGTFDDATPGTLQVLYRVYGRATTLLASLKRGARLDVLGPLGRGFEAPASDAEIVLVAGGIGSAPFPAFLKELARGGRKASLIYGARSIAELPLLDWFEQHAERVTVTTDDGSAGTPGLVTLPLAPILRDGRNVHVYACGPNAMLKAVAALAVEAGVRCDLSLEAPMACGFGVCLGCVVPVKGDGETRYERVCVEGPVLPASRMAW
ncbi:MAG TPA: dihydroorotate dehydrogenase electron transfer subunit, partial [Candidatus Bathyarchaeia archaeon]|nr:dihydroorotate dehydrogenase electron transfer subunit [Candidatus Bathyarchaeia archaeon]